MGSVILIAICSLYRLKAADTSFWVIKLLVQRNVVLFGATCGISLGMIAIVALRFVAGLLLN